MYKDEHEGADWLSQSRQIQPVQAKSDSCSIILGWNGSESENFILLFTFFYKFGAQAYQNACCNNYAPKFCYAKI